MASTATRKTRTVSDVEGALLSATPRSLSLAARGIRTGADFSQVMSALISDIIEEKVTPQVANAACNAGGKLLKVVEMQIKYGKRKNDADPHPILQLA
jgi:hypothetical protein